MHNRSKAKRITILHDQLERFLNSFYNMDLKFKNQSKKKIS